MSADLILLTTFPSFHKYPSLDLSADTGAFLPPGIVFTASVSVSDSDSDVQTLLFASLYCSTRNEVIPEWRYKRYVNEHMTSQYRIV